MIYSTAVVGKLSTYFRCARHY